MSEKNIIGRLSAVVCMVSLCLLAGMGRASAQMVNKVLNNGVEMPMLGLGTYTLRGDTAANAVKIAIRMGYRHFDTAQAYGNEEDVMEGIRQSGVKREEVFITSKVSPKNIARHRVRESIEESIAALGGYIDLMLIHFPVKEDGLIKETWQIMEEFAQAGKLRAIGISSFKQWHIDELLSYAKIVPAVNQIEVHPYFSEQELAGYNFFKGIAVEGWSPFGSGKNGVLNDAVIAQIAKRYGKSPAQVILRWNIQRGIIVIPRTIVPAEMRENLDIFDFQLSDVDMQIINGLNKNMMWNPLSDPDVVPWE